MEPQTRLLEYRPKRQPCSPHGFHEGRRQGDLLEDMRRRGPLHNKGELEVADDTIDQGEIREERDNFHSTALMQTMSTAKLLHLGQSMGSTLPSSSRNVSRSRASTGRNIIGVFIKELFEELIGVSDIHGSGSLVNEQDRYLSLEGKELMS